MVDRTLKSNYYYSQLSCILSWGGGGGGLDFFFFLISAKAECNKVKQFQYGWDREVNTTRHPFCDWTIFNVTGKLGNRIKGIFTHILCEPNEIFTLLMSF